MWENACFGASGSLWAACMYSANQSQAMRRSWFALVPVITQSGSKQPPTPTRKSSDTRVQGEGFPGTKCLQRDPWNAPIAPKEANVY